MGLLGNEGSLLLTPNWPTRGQFDSVQILIPIIVFTDLLAVAAALVASPVAALLGTAGRDVGRSSFVTCMDGARDARGI
jgi:hypothetical protein